MITFIKYILLKTITCLLKLMSFLKVISFFFFVFRILLTKEENIKVKPNLLILNWQLNGKQGKNFSFFYLHALALILSRENPFAFILICHFRRHE